MKKVISIKSRTLAIAGLGLIMFILPLMSLTRNPDFLHDAYFFSQAKALNAGLLVHRDIFSPYGLLVPTLLSVAMKVFGDYLIVVRVLGLVVLFGTIFLMFILLKRKYTIFVCATIICLFVTLSPERTEMSSSRWIYGLGIWPTHVTIFLTLVVLWITVAIFDTSNSSTFLYLKISLASILVPLLLVTRLQGILVFLVFFLFLLGYISNNIMEIRKRALIVLICLTASTSIILLTLSVKGVLQSTFYGMVFDPFVAASNTLNGRWNSWTLSLLTSLISSIFALVVLIFLITILLNWAHERALIIIIWVVLLFCFLYSATFDYPTEFNRNPIIWGLKIMSTLPSWIPWGLAIVFLSGAMRWILNLFHDWKSPNRETHKKVFGREDMLFLILGGASFSHLFWNYSYIYSIFPILIVTLSFINEKFQKVCSINTTIKVLSISNILLFSVVAFVGFVQPYHTYSNKLLLGFTDTRNYSIEMEDLVNLAESLDLESPSLYYCDYPIYRFFDTESYRRDQSFQKHPPETRVAYLELVKSSATSVFVCGNGNFFSANELEQTGWIEYIRREIPENPSLSLQILIPGGGG